MLISPPTQTETEESKIQKLLTLHEGKRLKPYLCTAKKTTIGIGRNLTDKGLSEAEISFLFQNDLAECRADLRKYLPWTTKLSEVRRAVLTDMRFNLGLDGLLAFKMTLESIRVGDYELAAQQMLQSKWAKQVKSRATRLSEMMRTDTWPQDVR